MTGLSVCAGLGEEDAALSWSLLKFYFTDTKVLTLWVPAFALAALLRVITHKYHHQLIFPACAYRFHHPSFPLPPSSWDSDVIDADAYWVTDFVALPIVFYVIALTGGFSIDQLRKSGWVFNAGESHDPWYKFYTQFGEFAHFDLIF